MRKLWPLACLALTLCVGVGVGTTLLSTVSARMLLPPCGTTKTRACPNGFHVKIANNGDPNGTALVGESQSGTGGVGLYGTTQGSNGAGVLGEDLGGAGHALQAIGSVRVDGNEFNLTQSVNATTANGSSAVYGQSTGTSGVPIGVVGTCESPTGRGMFAASNSTSGPGIGAYGISYGDSGRGLFGWAISGSGTNYGVYGQTSSSSGYGVYSGGNAYVAGNLTVTGSKVGYVVDYVQNVDSVALEPGDLVEIVGFGEPVLGEIPLILVRRATSGNPEAVLGPVAYAAEATPGEVMPPHTLQSVELAPEVHPAKLHISEIAGSVEPGRLAAVVTLGSFKFMKVDASFASVTPGSLLVSSPNPGYAMRATRPEIGTVVGKALGSLSGGTGLVPVLIQSR